MVVRVVAIVAVCPVSGGENTLALVIAELWFDSEQGMEAVLTSDTYKTVVFPDEKTFLDHGNTLILVGEQVESIGDHRAG
ncbi:EthD domain-containing protein [Qipengyuania flava]|uniref:EthD domain-containing protein n=1 Tax=Qipengyuania flava TaxID=192812 RepID=UPI00351879D2